jgi:hypothetical protein
MHTMDSGTAKVGLSQLWNVGFDSSENWKRLTKIDLPMMPKYQHNVEDCFKVCIRRLPKS